MKREKIEIQINNEKKSILVYKICNNLLYVSNKTFGDEKGKLWDIGHVKTGLHISGNFMTRKKAIECAKHLSKEIDFSLPLKELATEHNALIRQEIVGKYQFK